MERVRRRCMRTRGAVRGFRREMKATWTRLVAVQTKRRVWIQDVFRKQCL